MGDARQYPVQFVSLCLTDAIGRSVWLIPEYILKTWQSDLAIGISHLPAFPASERERGGLHMCSRPVRHEHVPR